MTDRARKYVWAFGLTPGRAGEDAADGTGEMKDLLGGKGAGLAEMARAGAPVPPGFTITTEACRIFVEGGGVLPAEIEREIKIGLSRLEEATGKRLGDPSDPLLLSVRSGAKFSMPGMMDTVLNLGLNDRTVEGLASKTGNPRFAWDCYRRLIQMFGNVVFGIDREAFEQRLPTVRAGGAPGSGTPRAVEEGGPDVEALRGIVGSCKEVCERVGRRKFPQDVREQLRLARNAVFESWNTPRAATYRKLNGISGDLGTAVNVQAMVFGNTGPGSATGVGFTRNPATGAREFYGEFLQNAQGEDVVAGIRTPRPLAELERVMPDAFRELEEIATRLERHYRDMQDFEFTIEDGRLHMLQTRTGKRAGFAAVRIACDMLTEGLIGEEEALMRVEPDALEQLLHPVFDPESRRTAVWDCRGLPASPGAATGRIVFSADDAVARAAQGWPVMLVRKETEPSDIHGMHAARGMLTATGGMTSHAAVVGRQMGKPVVVGCGPLVLDPERKKLTIGSKTVGEGDPISIDGSTGDVILSEVPTVPSEVIHAVLARAGQADSAAREGSEIHACFERILGIAEKYRRLEVRANADTPRDAAIARAFGARGIGLCRTEHMFFEAERIPKMQAMILADDAAGREKALAELLPLQREDFAGLFREMKGSPVTIRLIDPPLHEFLPRKAQVESELAALKGFGGARMRGTDSGGFVADEDRERVGALEKMLARVEALQEFNPMLGHRGCRLGITYPEITRMQTRAILEAALDVVDEGIEVRPEIMVPLVGDAAELANQREVVVLEAARVLAARRPGSGARPEELEFLVGTMIELPRACVTADRIAAEADFFSFGTNDLTQTALGMSRDDSGAFLPEYVSKGLLRADPFSRLDREGVGALMKIAVEKGRAARPELELGICGEHGGEPSSIEFCHRLGLDYVSASPYRVPVARLAAARAAIVESRERSKSSPADAGASGATAQ